MRRTLALLLPVVLAACSGGGNGPLDPLDNNGVTVITGIHYQTDRTTYSRWDEIVSQLLNATDHDIGYNLCLARLERRVGGGWVEVRRTPERVCTMPLYILRPGQSTTYREPASVVPAPGTYRLRTTVEAPLNNGMRSVATEPFTVQ